MPSAVTLTGGALPPAPTPLSPLSILCARSTDLIAAVLDVIVLRVEVGTTDGDWRGVIGVCYNGHYEEGKEGKKPTKNRRQRADTLADLQCASVNMCPPAIPMLLHVLRKAA